MKPAPDRLVRALVLMTVVVGCGGSGGGTQDAAAGTTGAAGSGAAGTGGTCRETAQACAMTTDCCVDLICINNACVAPPKCRAQQAFCAVTADCCTGLICTGNTCAPPPTCRGAGTGCAATNDCCSPLVCSASVCQKAPTCGDDVCAAAEVDTCCADCGCNIGFACGNGGACTSVGTSTVKFNFQNDCASVPVIEVRFFDPINIQEWAPKFVNHGPPQLFTLACSQNATVCFGARAENGTREWGIGLSGTGDCEDCCLSCAGANTSVYHLACP